MSESPAKKKERPKLCIGVKHFYLSTPPLSVNIKSQEIDEEKTFSNFVTASFEKLKSIQHQNLCQYIDLVLADHGMIKENNKEGKKLIFPKIKEEYF